MSSNHFFSSAAYETPWLPKARQIPNIMIFNQVFIVLLLSVLKFTVVQFPNYPMG
jgi:hypothetical protein